MGMQRSQTAHQHGEAAWGPQIGGRVANRVLVVEDSAVIRRLIEVCLRPADLEIIMREDGPSGLEAALNESPDLLVLDIGLPEMDGWEVLDRLRSNAATENLPVLVLTAHAEEESRRRADEGGAQHEVRGRRQKDLARVPEDECREPEEQHAETDRSPCTRFHPTDGRRSYPIPAKCRASALPEFLGQQLLQIGEGRRNGFADSLT